MEMVVYLKMREGADFFRGVTDCRSSFCLSVFTSEKLHPLLNICIYKTVSQYDEQDLNKRPKSRGKTTKFGSRDYFHDFSRSFFLVLA